jgi:hypothetical protein
MASYGLVPIANYYISSTTKKCELPADLLLTPQRLAMTTNALASYKCVGASA